MAGPLLQSAAATVASSLISFSMHSFSPHSGLTRYTLMKMCRPHHSCTCVHQSRVFALLAGVSIFAISGVAITVLMLRVTVPWASLLVEVAAASFDFCQKQKAAAIYCSPLLLLMWRVWGGSLSCPPYCHSDMAHLPPQSS